ncbi:MarR family transcriptional regulator [Streptomyces solincola]|uniref:MarR family transcriptional regulator n=1 Tax=Streptomyces solincola TaxID=2100817 RepID=A0A2S9PRJ8_9ACTN|nr:MarR family transcriptional regulator [Streptomyces solincola]PRH77050.1 MarR family transcriptional regulator [Streptomyces solincola]
MPRRSGGASHGDGTARAASAARDVVELLEVLWSQGADTAVTAPLSPSQLRVLYVLERAEVVNLRTLAGELGSTAPSVSRMCDRLHAVGYIERAYNPADRRELELRLSRHGSTYLARVRARREEALARAVSRMSVRDQAALARGLEALRSAARETRDGAGLGSAASEPA